MSKNLQRLLNFKIFQARLGLFWERLWQASFWPTMVSGVVVFAALSGLLGSLPGYIRFVLLGLAVVVLLVSLKQLIKLRWPSQAEALRRLEKQSGLSHRPVTAWHDDLSDHGGDAQTQIIWQAHKKRQHEMFSNLKSGIPRSNWMYLDPWAGRFTLALLLLVTVVLNGQNWRYELAGLAGKAPAKAVQTASLDAWISPPAYTRKPPLLLTSAGFKKSVSENDDIIVPEGSWLKVRVNNVAEFSLVLSKPLEDGGPGEILQTIVSKPDEDKQFAEETVVLKRPVHIALWYENKTQSQWKIVLIPDVIPVVEIEGIPQITPTGGFAIPWKVSDDYGVTSLKGSLTLVDKNPLQDNSSKAKALKKKSLPLQYDPPVFSAALPRLNPKKASGRAFQDLTSHPWAGQQVQLVMSAKDQTGQVGQSGKIVFLLPERRFSKPIARALVEQRRKLVETPVDKFKVVKTLAAMMAWPQGLIKKSGTYLGLRTLATRLHRAKTRKQIKVSVKEFWKLALAIEDGDLSEARRNLEAARRALQKALREGADPKKIAELTENLKKALNEYMAALTRQMQQVGAKNSQQQNGLQQNGREIRARDLQKMMDKIENLAKSGAHDAAQEMLSQLENILKNLNPGLAQKPMDRQRTPPEARSLEELTELMRKQRELMDKTFAMPDEDNSNKKSGKSKPGDGEDQQQNGKPGDQLVTQQDQLQNMLGKLMDRMSKNGLPSPRSLEQAKRAMRDATRALKNGRKGSALGMQGNAMQGLRKGAEAMAKEMMQRGVGDEGNYGRHSESGGDRNDPLGRPMPRSGADFGPDKNILPKESEIMRARDIMNDLRSRSNDRQRPKIELDYLQRLLDGLF